MYLKHLSLTHYRNYARLELDLPARINVLQGENAQGKTNLLEVIYYLATTKSPLATSERQLMAWAAECEVIPHSFVRGVFERADGEHSIEITLVKEREPNGAAEMATLRRQIRLDGAPRRAIDVVGKLNVVLFLPEDIILVAGAPAERRRYFDIMLCQIDALYCRTLSRYNRVMSQRNALLRQLRENRASAQELDYWDEQLVELGVYVLARRLWAIVALSVRAQEIHPALTGGQEQLALTYQSSLAERPPHPGPLPEGEGGEALPSSEGGGDTACPLPSSPGGKEGAARPLPSSPGGKEGAARPLPSSPGGKGDTAHPLTPSPGGEGGVRGNDTDDLVRLKEQFYSALRRARREEIARTVTLAGPHRDDVRFLANGIDMTVYGSRGQQRTVALTLKLAEVALMEQQTGEMPILLLDDVISELDRNRCGYLLQAVRRAQQVLITTTDLHFYAQDFLDSAMLWRVVAGSVLPLSQA